MKVQHRERKIKDCIGRQKDNLCIKVPPRKGKKERQKERKKERKATLEDIPCMKVPHREKEREIILKDNIP